ncbi:MAG: choice-of-anchor Q domain-containing protein [Chloroflexota bacterium]
MNTRNAFYLIPATLILNMLLMGFVLAVITSADETAFITITVDTPTDSNLLTVCSDVLPNDCSLRGAITKANGDASNQYSIIVPPGLYTLSVSGAGEDNNATGDLDITASMLLRGDIGTIINGNQLDRVLDVHSGITVTMEKLLIQGGHAPDGLPSLVPGGSGTNGDDGGGIRNTGVLTITDCTIANNQSGTGGAAGVMPGIPLVGGNGGNGGNGGGIYNNGILVILDSTISGNLAGSGGAGGPAGNAVAIPGGIGGFGGNGGGIANDSTLTIVQSSILNNKSGAGGMGGTGSNGVIPPFGPGGPGGPGGNGGSGGGIFNTSNLTITLSTVDGNITGDGGMAGTAGVPGTPAPSLFSLPAGSGGDGAGIYNLSGAIWLRIDSTTLSNNVTGNGGTGGTGAVGSMAPVGPGGPGGLAGNGGNGGGLYNDGNPAIVINTTLSGNLTGKGGAGGAGGAGGGGVAPGGNGGNGGNGGFGGGIFNQAVITLTNNTIASNQTGLFGVGGIGGLPGGVAGAPGMKGDGGGVAQNAGTVSLRNTIIGDNTGSVDNDCWGTFNTLGYNLIETASPNCLLIGDLSGNIMGQDPRLFSLGNHGGSNQTHALKDDSPAIDSANPATPGSGGNACATDDQRKDTRDDMRCDIGAFELQYADSDTVQKCSLATGSYTFGPTLAQIDVTSLGSLSCLSVKLVNHHHPNAGIHYQTGRYWTITPTGLNYTVNLTLPHNLPDHSIGLIGKYTGSGQNWVFGRTSATPSRISLHGITQLSDWAVGSNYPPTLTLASKAGFINSVSSFCAADFANHFHDKDGDTLQKVKIITLPITGTLKLSNTAVMVNQVITATNLSNLTYTPPSGWTGNTNFGWNGYDGMSYALSSGMMNITITLRSLYLPIILR